MKKSIIIKLKQNPSYLFVFLLLFVFSTIFLLGCSNKNNQEDILNNVTDLFTLNTIPNKLTANYNIKHVRKNGNTNWTGEVQIVDLSSGKQVFSLSYKFKTDVDNKYKHIFEDTKNNKIVFTTDTSLHNPEIVKNETSLTGFTFS